MNKIIGFLTLLLAQNIAFADNIAGAIQAKVNKDASKIEIVKGVWIIKYRTNGTDRTENLAIEDTTTLSNGDIAGGGYLHSATVPSLYLPTSCFYSPITTLNTDYLCATTTDGKTTALFAFSFSGNRFTTGYYGIGSDSQTAAFSLSSKNTVVTGNRIDNNDVFDISTNLLTLPSVQVGPTKYSATLKFENNVFIIQSANPK